MKCIIFALSFCLIDSVVAQAPSNQTTEAKITVLSTNLSDGNTIGEWGFSAFIEANDHCVLFDTGRFPDTVIKNADFLNVDLTCVTDIVLSHNHFDHTSGLLPLINNLRSSDPSAVKTVHVARGIFEERRRKDSHQSVNQMIEVKKELEALNIAILIHEESTEIYPSIWVTGPIARINPEMNYGQSVEVHLNNSWVNDHIPESQGLVVVTPEGPIVILGCGHSGVVNMLEQVQETIQDKPVHALMGGMHLFQASEETLDWTEGKLREIGLQNLMAGHCTGLEPLYRFRRNLASLSRENAVVGAVGSSFIYGTGIKAGRIAR